MRLTKRQKDYLSSAAINPTGQTIIPIASFTALEKAGLVVHTGYNRCMITPAGRAALAASPRSGQQDGGGR